MAVDWNSHEMRMWKEEAVKEQQDYFDMLGTDMWRLFKPSDYNKLKRNIGFALFGLPDKEPYENLNDDTGYTDKKLKHINKIFDVIKKGMKNHKDPENIWVSFLFVSGKAGDDSIRIPVIRIPVFDIVFPQNIICFVDSCGRVYEGWQDYLENNMIPECVLCYPKNGEYSAVNGIVEVEFGISPAGKTGRKVLEGFDVGGTILYIGASGVLFAAMCVPVAWPVVTGAAAASVLSGGYAAGRSIQTLVDRGQHQQSIGLDSAESRNCWLGIGGCLMSLASGGATAAVAKTAQGGATVALAGQIAIKSVTFGSCVFNALGVTNGLANIIMKVVNKEEITALDIFQFTSAVFFFTNSVISAKQAMSLIHSMEENSPGGFQGTIQSFMNKISKTVKQNNACKSTPPVVCGWSPMMSTPAKGTTLFCVCKWVSLKLFEITERLWKGLISMRDYVVKVREFLVNFWESWNEEITEVADRICQAFGVKHWSEILIRGHRPLAGAEPHYIREMAGTLITEERSLVNCGTTVMPSQQRQVISDRDTVGGTVSHNSNGPNSLVVQETETSVSYDDEVINILAKFVDRQGCRSPTDFAEYMTFVCKFVKSQFLEEKSHYENTWAAVKKFSPDVNVEDFVKQYGISGNPNNHFIQEVFKKFRSEEKYGFTLLKLAYDSQNVCTSAQKVGGQTSFEGDGVSFHPFYNKHGLASNKMLSKEQYCEMAAKLTGQHADQDSICMSACGTTAVMQVNGGVDIIMVHCLLEDGKVSGIAALLRSPSE